MRPARRRVLCGIAGYRGAGLEERTGRAMRRRQREYNADENLSNAQRDRRARVAFGHQALRKLIAGEEAKSKARRRHARKRRRKAVAA